MANVTRTVDIIFNGDDQLTKAVKNINRSLGDFDTLIRNIADPLATLGKGILAADAALAGLVGTGLALAIRESGKFNDAFGEISTIVHADSEALEEFRQNIIAYGQDSTASIENINSAIYTAISAGVAYEDSISTVSEAERLAVAGRADLESTTRLLASTMNAYGLSAEESGKLSDIFFKTVELGLTTIPELADNLAKVSSIAAAAGVPIEELQAAIAALTASGLGTDIAMTALRATISTIISPSREAEEAAKALRLEFGANALETKGLAQVLREIQEATGGETEKITSLFGNVRGLTAVLNLANDSSGRFAKALDAMADATGATATAYAKMEDNFSLVNQRLINNVLLTMVKVGDELQGGYADIVRNTTQIFRGLSAAIDAGTFDPIFALFEEFGGKLSILLGDIAEALPEAFRQVDFTELLDALRETALLFGNLFGDVDFGDADDLAGILQEIIDTITGLVYVTNSMINTFIDIFNTVRTGVQDFSDLDSASQDLFGRILAGAIVVSEAGVIIGSAILSMTQNGLDLTGTFETMAGIVQAAFNGIMIASDVTALAIAANLQLIVATIDTITFGLSDTIGNARTALSEFIAGGIEDIQDKAEGVVEGFGRIVGGVEDFTDANFEAQESVDGIGQKVGEIPEEKVIDWGVVWDDMEADTARREMEEALPDETEIEVRAPITPVLDEVDLKTQLQYAEKIAKIQADINIAEIEAETKRIEAAFQSIEVSIESTGDTLVSLFGQLVDTKTDMLTRWKIEDQIRLENERREKALELQERLTEAQITALQERIKAMQRGDPLIMVDGAGLQPHLEAFMWEILSAIQVRVNEEQLDFLLGINP